MTQKKNSGSLILVRKKVIPLPNSYNTDVLNYQQIEFLAKKLPCPKSSIGRPSYSNIELLPGVLRVLRSGMRWRDLDDKRFASSVTHWRRLRFWERKMGLKKVFDLILGNLNLEKKLDIRIASIDGSLVPSFNFLDTTGFSGKHYRTGTKLSTMTDFLGLPLNIVFAPGNRHDQPLAMPTLVNNPVGKPNILLADKGYDSDKFKQKLKELNIEPNIPQRNIKNREKQGHYNIPLGKMRFKIERTNGWIKSFRRVHFRFDYTLASFKAFTYLALIVICVRKLI